MSQDYIKHHFVQCEYLKAWAGKNKKIIVRSKLDEELRIPKRPEDIMFVKNYYTIYPEDFLFMNATDEDFFFSELNDYTIYYENLKLTNLSEFKLFWHTFDLWKIRDSEGLLVNNELLKRKIENKRIVDIETGWHDIEGELLKIRSEIYNAVQNRNSSISDNVRASLIKYITMQRVRINSRKELIRDFVSFIIDLLDDRNINLFGQDETKITLIEKFTDAYFRKSLRDYQVSDNNSILLEEQYLNELEIKIYTTTLHYSFLTSDNPVLLVDGEFCNGNYKGIYFAITPNIIIRFYSKYKNPMLVEEMPANTIRRLNKLIIENSDRFYVANNN